MKIYEIGTGYTPIPAQMGAATEIVVEELVKAFQKRGEQVELLDIQADCRQPHDLPLTQVPVPGCFSGTDVQLGVMHKLKRVVYSVALAGKLKKILRNTKEQVIVHFHNQYNLFFFLKLVSPRLRAKAKIAYTVHSYIWPGRWEDIKDTIQKRYFQEVVCVQNADYVLVLNDQTAAHFVRHLGVPAERIHQVGNGVNTDTYHIMDRGQLDAFRQEADLHGRKLIFQVGSVCDRKNQLGAVQMLRPYLQAHPDVVYAYAGGIIDGAYQEEILRFAKDNGIASQVRYLGELCPGEALNRYYNAAGVTVFPSKIESFGLVIIESLAAGTPVILAEGPLFRLERGWRVFDSGEGFCRAVDAYLHGSYDPRQARDEVIASYGWDKTAGDHLEIWKNQEARNG